jgi:hypothetical protein
MTIGSNVFVRFLEHFFRFEPLFEQLFLYLLVIWVLLAYCLPEDLVMLGVLAFFAKQSKG